MKGSAIVLIDYDNLSPMYRGNYTLLEHTIYENVSTITKFDRIEMRLYGGWFEFESQTIAARELSIWVHTLPKSIEKTVLSGSLAQSLAFENVNLPWTYRRRTRKTHITVNSIPRQCTTHDCNVVKLKSLLDIGKCNDVNCGLDFKDVILYNEQKLVDSMITLDLLYFADQGYDAVVLVSSDDDFIPALRRIASEGKKVYVLHTNESAQYRYKDCHTVNFRNLITEGWMNHEP